jgi:hypothetical protein
VPSHRINTNSSRRMRTETNLKKKCKNENALNLFNVACSNPHSRAPSPTPLRALNNDEQLA